MARAAINVLGATGATYDFVTNGSGVVSSSRESVGVYRIIGCLGMVPFPPIDDGWGYTVNQIDSRADVDTDFTEGVLTVTVTKDGKPYDLKHMITLHILVPDAEVMEMPPAVAESESEAPAEG
ncbi:hypothetical protein [Pseudomonas sp. WS 5413]|uniref:hypothetical protein n=1 Tax=Pseudomonas sp. WS 5413 TaxID=2717488 RepID=UPI00147320A2|nr:hypothetical protein [Pseudomonas sp. WS 5413]NMX31128.1 hypothetical protein [Pseudomonas sp. WS 5413]